jgi:hypothetical protein
MRSLTVAALVAVGCGASNAPPAPVHGYQLATGDYTVGAGTEHYFCFAHTLTEAEAVAITRFDVFASQSVHHSVMFKTLAPEPEGFSDCPVLAKETWLPMFAGGRNTQGLDLPTGAGFYLKANDQILLQLHLLNATLEDSTEHTFINLTYADDANSITPAGIFALGTMNIDIPAGARDYTITADCNVDKTLNVFAAFPHMHQIGTKITLEHSTTTAAAATMMYARDPWVFGDQPMDSLPVTINKGDYLRASCSYDNNTGVDVKFGEHTSNEMCYLVLFYTPFDHLDGCIR